MNVNVKIKVRRDHSTNWSQNNPILHEGEIGFEIDTYRIKIGDGIKRWNDLPYYTEIEEYNSLSDFPVVGRSGRIYIAKNANKLYRWDGSSYVEFSGLQATWGSITGNITNQTDLMNLLNQKQDLLVSGVNIKTINNQSLLGSGNITIGGGGVNINVPVVMLDNNSYTATGNVFIIYPSGLSGNILNLTIDTPTDSWYRIYIRTEKNITINYVNITNLKFINTLITNLTNNQVLLLDIIKNGNDYIVESVLFNIASFLDRGFVAHSHVGSYSRLLISFSYTNETPTNHGDKFSIARAIGAGLLGNLKGYSLNGEISGGNTRNVEGFNIINLTIFNLGNLSSTAKGRLTSFQTTNMGYTAGGRTTTTIDQIESLNFSTENMNVLTATIITPRYSPASLSHTNKGYVLGGHRYRVGNQSTITAFTFNTQTSTNLTITLSLARYGLVGVNNNEKGFIIAGGQSGSSLTNRVEIFNFSNETIAIGNNFIRGVRDSMSLSTKLNGYVLGGHNGSNVINTISKVSYNNNSYSDLSATLHTNMLYGASIINFAL